MLRAVLVPIDFSPSSDRVVGRIGQLPLASDARISLLHVVSHKLPAHTSKNAERDAKKALAVEVEALARTVPNTVTIRDVVTVGAPATEIVRCARSMRTELVVMGRGGGRALRDLFLGSTSERVIRQGKLPVLVVRLHPRTPYRRPALALDVDEAARQVFASLLRVTPSPPPQVAIIHAYDVPYRGLTYPSLPRDEADESGDEYRQKVVRELSKLVDAALADVAPKDRPFWSMHVQHGSARTIIEKAVKRMDVDLLTIGTRGYSGVAHAFLGTVAGDVLRSVACDVLVVPPRRSA